MSLPTLPPHIESLNDGVKAWYLLSMKSRLKLEMKGIKFRDGSTYAYLKREFGYKGNREKVLADYTADLKEAGWLKDAPS